MTRKLDEQSPPISRVPEFLRDLGLPAPTNLVSGWTTVQGRKLHSRGFSMPGDHAPFVLIHGLVISSLYMIPLAECLSERHEVHALDLPGFGRSEAPDHILSIPKLADAVVAWLEETGMRRCHLVANSLGCEIAAHVAVKAPDRVASLVLIGPTLDPHAFALTIQTLRLMRDALNEPLRLWMNWIFDFIRAGPRRAFGTTGAMFRDHIENQLPRITAPTLIMRGGWDPTVPQKAAMTMKDLLVRGQLMVIEGQPHCVHYTDPKTVCRVVEAHAGTE